MKKLTLLIAALVVISCSVEQTQEQQQPATTLAAVALLHDLQAKFVAKYEVPAPIEQQLLGDDTPSTATKAVFATSLAQSITANGGALIAQFARQPLMAVEIPQTATAPIKVSSAAVSVRVSVLNASSVAAELAEGFVLYRGAAPGGGHVVLRPSEEGVEDFVTFDQILAKPELSYKIEFVSGVGGLRLVGNSLEVVDGAGTPRLRARAPYVVDSVGHLVGGKLAISNCPYDSDPRAPWGNVPVAPKSSACTVTVSWSNSGLQYPIVVDPSWASTGAMGTARADHTLTLLDTGNVLAACGVNSAPSLPGAELYNPTTGTWAATGSPTQLRYNHIAAKLTNGKVLIAGGWTGTGALTSSELYDPSAGTWSTTGSLNSGRKIFIGEILPNGKVLVSGGYGGRSIFSSAELYDPTAATWSTTGSMATARAAHRSTLMGSRVLVAGGTSGTYQSSAEIYSQDGGTWSSAGNMSTARAAHAQARLAVGYKVIAAGGTSDGSNTLSSADVYDPIANSWSAAPSMNAARKDFQATLLQNSNVVFAGGQSASGYTSSADLYVQIPLQVSSTTGMQTARSRYASSGFAAPNTKQLIAGGYDGTNYLTASETFDVADVLGTSTTVSDGWSLPRVMLTWDGTEGLTGTYSTSTNVTATLSNNDTTLQRIFVDLTATGLDDRIVTRSAYFDVALNPGSSTQLNVPASAFPIESVGSEAQLILTARPHDINGVPTGESFAVNTKFFYEFNSSYTQVIFHGANGADLDRTQPSTSSTYSQWKTSTSSMRSGLSTVAGKVYSQSGGFVDVSTLSPAPHGRHAQYAMKGQWAKDLDGFFPSILADYVPPFGAKYYKFCGNWQVSYHDAGYGEAYLATKGLQKVPAAYANYLVLAGADTVSVGQLQSDGCTPALLLGNTDTFQFFFMTQIQKGSTTIRVINGPNGEWCQLQMGGGCAQSIYGLIPTFYVFSLTMQNDGSVIPAGAPQYDNNNSKEEYTTRAIGAVGLTFGLSDNGLLSNTQYNVEANTGCFADKNGVVGEACGTAAKLRLGKSFTTGSDHKPVANGVHTTYSKYTIAHEFGHTTAANLFGLLNFSPIACTECVNGKCGTPDAGAPLFNCQQSVDGLPAVNAFPEGFCRCDYVTAGNQFHCLQSKEIQGFANNEGLAHFYAANLFNNTATTSCTFVYYKDSLQYNQNISTFAPIAPPQGYQCYYTSTPQKWFKTQCALLPTKKGVEYDWMTFLYEVHNKTSNALSFDDVRQMYEKACNNGTTTLCNGESVFFDESASGSINPGSNHLKHAAELVFGFNSNKALYVSNTGTKHGVNNN